ANGFMEELIARGLFLKKFQPFLGTFLSNLVTAIVFSIAHVGVTYSSDLLTFLVVLFVFALLAGFLMQKTDALWGFGTFPRGSRYSDHDRNICWREDVRATAELD